MEAVNKIYKLKLYFVVKLLFLFASSASVYGRTAEFCENEDANVCAWYILNVARILQNAKDNIVVSPSNIKALLQRPQTVDLRIGGSEEMSGPNAIYTESKKNLATFFGQNAIYTESKKNLNSPENLEMFYDCEIQEISFNDEKNIVTTFDDWTTRISTESFKVIVLNIYNFKETLQINFKYALNITYQTRSDSIIVPAVETTEYLKYLDSQILDAKILELPYSNGFSMYILLPHTKQGVDEMINNLGYEQLKRIEWMMEERRVNVILPTFQYSFATIIRDHIQKNSAHRFDVDLNEIYGIETDKIKILQFTIVHFNGSGAAVVEDYNKIRATKYERFHVDRPFAFYIEEKRSGRIVCIGKVLNPSN